MPRVFVNYSDLLNDYVSVIKTLQSLPESSWLIDSSGELSKVEEFLHSDQHHHRLTETESETFASHNASIASVYDILSNAQNRLNHSDSKHLDGIRFALRVGSELVGGTVYQSRHALAIKDRDITCLSTEISELKQFLAIKQSIENTIPKQEFKKLLTNELEGVVHELKAEFRNIRSILTDRDISLEAQLKTIAVQKMETDNELAEIDNILGNLFLELDELKQDAKLKDETISQLYKHQDRYKSIIWNFAVLLAELGSKELSQYFCEEQYLSERQDIVDNLTSGTAKSALGHWLLHGGTDDRPPPLAPVEDFELSSRQIRRIRSKF